MREINSWETLTLNEISIAPTAGQKYVCVFLSESRWTMLSKEREEDPGKRSSSQSKASEKQALHKSTSDPAESIPQSTETEESSQTSPEEGKVSALSRKCPSEEPEVPRKEENDETETPAQEVDGLAPKPENKDEGTADEEDKTTPDGPTQQNDQVQSCHCRALNPCWLLRPVKYDKSMS